jgi:PAS domain S-box-containing protein
MTIAAVAKDYNLGADTPNRSAAEFFDRYAKFMPSRLDKSLTGFRGGIVLSVSWGIALAVFIVDLLTPVGVEVWVLYLPVILVGAWLNDSNKVIISSAICSILVIVGAIVSTPGGANPPWWDVMNRSMGLLAIGLTAWTGITICNRSTRLFETANQLRKEVAKHEQTSAELRDRDERLELAVAGSGMGTWDIDERSGLGHWSEATFRMMGLEPNSGKVPAQNMWRSRVLTEDLPRVLDAQAHAQCERSLYSCEYRIHRADNGETVWLSSFGRYRYDKNGTATRFTGVSFDITEKKTLERETLEVAAREQTRIGQGLHDGLGQELTGLGLMAKTLMQLLPNSSKERQIVDHLVAGFQRVHEQARSLARGLMPVDIQDFGLADALRELTERLSEQTGLSVSFRADAQVANLDHPTATHLFHIAQEALTNSLRHGQPRHIAVTLVDECNAVRLAVHDDGIGICSRYNGKGLGIRIMRHRADQIGGVLQIDSANGRGTLVTCTLTKGEANGAHRR